MRYVSGAKSCEELCGTERSPVMITKSSCFPPDTRAEEEDYVHIMALPLPLSTRCFEAHGGENLRGLVWSQGRPNLIDAETVPLH